jgi:hypothetical protein
MGQFPRVNGAEPILPAHETTVPATGFEVETGGIKRGMITVGFVESLDDDALGEVEHLFLSLLDKRGLSLMRSWIGLAGELHPNGLFQGLRGS